MSFAVTKTEVKSRGTLGVNVFDLLLDEIATGKLRPGMILREIDLSERFGVSRTPVREALYRLKDHGLAVDDGRSVRIRTLTLRDVADLYTVRRSLELTAVRLAWGRLTADDFDRLRKAEPAGSDRSADDPVACAAYDRLLHRTIAIRSGNELLVRTLRRLHDQVLLVCRPVGDRVDEHRAIVNALQSGDRRSAMKAMADHLKAAYRAQRTTVRALSENSLSERSDSLSEVLR